MEKPAQAAHAAPGRKTQPKLHLSPPKIITAISANCVTGFIVVNTAAHWTVFETGES